MQLCSTTTNGISMIRNGKWADAKELDLSKEDFKNGNLSGVDFTDADLTKADLTDSSFQNSTITRTCFWDTNVTRTNFSGTRGSFYELSMIKNRDASWLDRYFRSQIKTKTW